MGKLVEIEQLWRVKLSHLKPLLDASKELRELPPEEKKRSCVQLALRYSREGYYTEELKMEVF